MIGVSTPIIQRRVREVLFEETGLVFSDIYTGLIRDLGSTPPNNLTLGVTGGGSATTEGKKATGLLAGNGISQFTYDFQNSTQTWVRAIGDNTIGNPSVSIIVVDVFFGTGVLPGSTSLISSKRSAASGNLGYSASIRTDGRGQLFLDGNVPALSLQTIDVIWAAQWIVTMYLIDVTNQVGTIESNRSTLRGTSSIAAVLPVDSLATTFSLNRGFLTAGANPTEYALSAIAYGAQCEGLTNAAYKAVADNIATRMFV